MIQICENGHNRIAYDDQDQTEHDGCPYCSMYKDMSEYLQNAKEHKPLTTAEAEGLVDGLIKACNNYNRSIGMASRFLDADRLTLDEARAALIAALTGGKA